MDESYRSWLAMIPGVGQRKATALAERFPTLEALRAASHEDIEGIEGFGPVLARRVKEFAERSGDRPDFWYKKDASLYFCPYCGKLIAQTVANCPFCGTELEGEQTVVPEVEIPELEDTPRADVLQPQGQSLNLCPGCGAFVGKDLAVCPSCGTTLAGEEVAEEGQGIAAVSADVLQKEGQGLYLCPSCAALISQDASVCPKCGSAVEGEEVGPTSLEPVVALPPEATSGEGSLFICTNCGAFLRPQDTKCPSCGVEFEEGEVAAESLVAEKEEEISFFPICPNCGALIPSTLKRCAICGHRRGEPVGKPVEEKVEEPGITKDFLERWRRVSEERAETPTQKLERELQQYEDILAADPTLERTWMKKIGILLRLGRVTAAVASYEKLADLRPDREEDYRLQVLSVLRAQGDMSMLPRRWSQVAATEPAREIAAPAPKAPPAARAPAKVPAREAAKAVDDAKVVEALAHYDRLLSIDPALVGAWQTKAELLERLGRTAEARRALRRADELQRPPDGSSGLRSISPRVGPRMEGRVNGTKGRTNGRINGTGRINGIGRINGTTGRTNGRINGTKGRTNGKVSGMGRINGTRVNGGRVNGLVSPAGRTNGMMSGVAPGEGMVNGLVNGNGFTNGRRGRWTPPKAGTPRDWMRSVTGIAAAVLLLLMIPIFATLLSTSPPPGGITIDGLFEDWAGVPAYEDDAADQVVNPDVNMISFRMRAADEAVLVYARVSGVAFQANAGGGDSLYAFVDEDGDAATGFRIGALGAERAVEVFGWDRMVMGTSVWEYDPTRAGTSSDDWRAFDLSGGGAAANGVSEIEARIDVGPAYQPSRFRVLLQTLDRAGNGDPADGVVGAQTGALVVVQSTVAPGVVTGTAIPFLSVTVKPLAPPIAIATIDVEKLGSYPSAGLVGRLFLDQDANGVLDATDPLLGTSSFVPSASFPIGRTLERAETYLFVADLPAPAPNASIGFRVLTVAPVRGADVPVTLRDADVTLAYLDGAPTNVTVDGAFADWAQFPVRGDVDDDVQSSGRNRTVNENIDLRLHEAVVRSSVSLYLRVDGRILGGVDIPNFRDRPPVESPTLDADGDQVPDAVEEPLGLLLAFDFNNDNVSDADQLSDVDQDGLLDYNACQATDCSAYTDYILETTIPAWYPPPYAGRVVRRYVGPVSLPAQRGVDTASVYMDRDNRSDTGLYVTVEGVPYGMDYAYQAVGRSGTILEAALYRHNASLTIPWEKVTDVPTAIDSRQLEAGFDAALVNLTANHTFVFMTTDWQSNVDTGLLGQGLRSAPSPSTRSAGAPEAPPRVLDIFGNQRFYLRNTNHATETACTTNKVASGTQGAGPSASVQVGAGQNACWYADATTGTTISAGDWEALLDILVAHGLVVYTQTGTSNPRYREWTGSFGAEGLMPPSNPGLEQWVVVVASPVSPEMVVGIMSDNNRLYVRTWSGAGWTADWDVAVGGPDSRRKFDIAYEEGTDNVVVVFGDATTQLKYRQRTGGTWSATLNAGTPLTDVPYWVRTGSRPTNADVFVGVVTNAQTLHAMRWNGATDVFGDQVQMSGTVTTDIREGFDIAFERASGDAFVIWGSEALELRAREFTTAWQAETVAYTLPSDARWVVADYDPRPTSSSIAVGMVLDNGNFTFGAWDGTQWVARPAVILANNIAQRGIDVAFERDTGRAIYAFNQNANPTQIAWRPWTAAGGFGSVTALPGTTANLRFVQLRSNPHRNEIMALYHDTNNDLFYRHWSGAAWSTLGPALETALSAGSVREPFMFAWTRVVEYDVHFEIWNKTTNAVREVVGSCLDRRTYGNDTQCLVAGVPQKTIAADEVVRLRVAHSSLGGTFLLQFDDIAATGDSRITLPAMIPEFETLLIPMAVLFIIVGVRRLRRKKEE